MIHNERKCNCYKFGFNGKEKDDEWNGTIGGAYDYGFRIYNPRIAKFLSVDPLTKNYPFYTPYQFAGNKPIMAIDLDGLEDFEVIKPTIFGISYVQVISYKGLKTMVEGIGTGGVDYIDQNSNRQRKQGFSSGSIEDVVYNQFKVPYYTLNSNGGYDKHIGPFKDAVGNIINPPGSNPEAPGNSSLYRSLSTSIAGETSILFNTDKSSLVVQDVQGDYNKQISELDKLGQTLKDNPYDIAIVSGYTDKDANADYNLHSRTIRTNYRAIPTQ